MASLGICAPTPLNLKNYENRTQENISWAIKNFEKYFMAHQYVPKIFHDPNKNPPPLPPVLHT